MNMRFSSAIFDVDGTLLDSSAMWESLATRYLLQLGLSPEQGLSDKLHSLTLEESVIYLRSEYSIPFSEQEIIRQLTRLTERFYKLEVQPKAGAKRLLTALKARSIRMYLSTAGNRQLATAALSRLGLWDYFAGMVCCSEYGSKTSPEIFLAAAEMMFDEPQTTIVFENSLFAIQTAKQAGFITAAVHDISEKSQDALKNTADLYAQSLSDYPEMLFVSTQKP